MWHVCMLKVALTMMIFLLGLAKSNISSMHNIILVVVGYA